MAVEEMVDFYETDHSKWPILDIYHFAHKHCSVANKEEIKVKKLHVLKS